MKKAKKQTKPKTRANKKEKKISTKKKKVNKKVSRKATLPPGKKKCKQCGALMGIHKKVCGSCGQVHKMKKDKEQIMRSVQNKITPIIIKSIIENNDFNNGNNLNESVMYELGGLKQSQEGIDSIQPRFQKPNSQFPRVEVMKTNHPLVSIDSTQYYLLFLEVVQKKATSLTPPQEQTVNLYQLQQYHAICTNYEGQCLLRVWAHDSKRIDTVRIGAYAQKVKGWGNVVGLLMGDWTIRLLSIPITIKTVVKAQQFLLEGAIRISCGDVHRYLCFQFLKASESPSQFKLATGLSNGAIVVHSIRNGCSTIFRQISRAHGQAVCCLSECPISTSEKQIFASASMDGTVTIWNLHEKQKLFSFQPNNKRIWQLAWDPGAKFLFILKDEPQDNCALACFYSINKIQENVHMSETLELRTIKYGQTYHMCAQHKESECIGLLSAGGWLRFLGLEELRGKAIKKKKVKQSGGQIILKLHQILKQPQPTPELPHYTNLTTLYKNNQQITYIGDRQGRLIRYSKS